MLKVDWIIIIFTHTFNANNVENDSDVSKLKSHSSFSLNSSLDLALDLLTEINDTANNLI